MLPNKTKKNGYGRPHHNNINISKNRGNLMHILTNILTSKLQSIFVSKCGS